MSGSRAKNVDLKEFARRADEAEQALATMQAQIDYLSTMNASQTLAKPSQQSEELKNSLDDVQDLVLQELGEEKAIDSREFAQKYNLSKDEVYGAINALEAEQYVSKQQKSTAPKTIVSSEGLSFIEHGSPEVLLFNQLSSQETDIGALQRTGLLADDKMFTVAKNKACKNKWISIDKKRNVIEKQASSVTDLVKQQLLRIQTSDGNLSGLDKSSLKELKSRKLLASKQDKYFVISRGANYSAQRKEQVKDITLEVVDKYMDIDSNAWNGPEIKKYNFNAKGQTLSHGALHPLMKMRTEMRRILLDMGFEEMQTNRYVESSFWNFDALFQPQQHPARDAHDTFFLDQPHSAEVITEKYAGYMQRVKATHTNGGYGSIGWRYDWKESEAKKNLLRTHTTAVSSRTLYKLAQMKPFKPSKYFSIDRVFRNESIDATHLAEFHQVEGFIADYDLTLGHLLGVIAEFFKRIGIPDVRFKPAYNPYTEPSMEIFGKSAERDEWIEVGNSGVFRPEMLEPMGLPPNVKVIAWGLGLERPCMIATGVKDIRTLFGPRVDINMVKHFPIVRYDEAKPVQEQKKGFKDM